ncbi:LysR family transcriptional regulator [Undibacterium sp. TC4M20W]|uniref:LysR family transcriptional regulator n=1 Tax=Undibacterium sp. TC4M20W TaxID=3413052 RepID=UPI003BF2367D
MVSIKRTIDSGLLEVFVHIVHHGGVSAAAVKTGNTKSAISKQLAALETHLQVRLFERNGRRMMLTQEGKSLFARAESILADFGQLVEDVQNQKTLVRGTVRLAASPEFGALLSEHFIPQVLARYPELKISMSLEYAFDDLHDPAIDLALRLGTVRDERLVVRHLGDLQRVLVCSKSYLKSHAIGAVDDLATAEVVLFLRDGPEPSWTLQSTANAAETCEVRLRGRFAVQGVGALARAAIGNLGVVQIPAFVAAPHIADGSLVRVLPHWDPIPLPVQLAYRAGVSRVSRVRAVIESATTIIPELLDRL